MPTTRYFIATPQGAGAVGVIWLYGPEARQIGAKVIGRALPASPGRVTLTDIAGLDEGLAAWLAPGPVGGEESVLLMPHGGPRVMQRIAQALESHGAHFSPDPDPLVVYPEASSRIEALMLRALSRLPGPAGLGLLLAQPALWQEALTAGKPSDPAWCRDVLDRSRGAWRWLLEPATVVVIGAPNVGKSTLSNRVRGRDASIVADLPGTTRDRVGGAALLDDVLVRWFDTPGLRDTDDPIEAQAIRLTLDAIRSAQVMIAMRDSQTDWPDTGLIGRRPDLWIIGKADRLTPDAPTDNDPSLDPSLGTSPDTPLWLSPEKGWGVDALGQAVLTRLGLDAKARMQPRCWAFCPELQAALEPADDGALRGLVEARRL